MRARPPIPPPPPGPTDKAPPEGFGQSRFWRDDRISPEVAARSDEALDLYNAALEATDDRTAAETLARSLRLHPHTKTAFHLSRRMLALDDSAAALAFAGLAYALNPRHDQSAVNFAQLLADHANPERAWAIIGETLTRNASYEPAWKLLDSLEAQR